MKDIINLKVCMYCGKDLIDLPGRRQKLYCNSTCRSNYWKMSDRLVKKDLSTEQIVVKMSEHRNAAIKQRGLVKHLPEQKKVYKPIKSEVATVAAIKPTPQPDDPGLIKGHIAEYQKELAELGKGQVAEITRKHLKKKIKELQGKV